MHAHWRGDEGGGGDVGLGLLLIGLLTRQGLLGILHATGDY
jgi:hypothetical protein